MVVAAGAVAVDVVVGLVVAGDVVVIVVVGGDVGAWVVVVVVTGAVTVDVVIAGAEVFTDVVVVNIVVVVDVGAWVVVVVATRVVVGGGVAAGVVVVTGAAVVGADVLVGVVVGAEVITDDVVVVLVEVGSDDVVHVFWVSGIQGMRTYPEVEGDTRLRSRVMELMWAAFIVAAWGSRRPVFALKNSLVIGNEIRQSGTPFLILIRLFVQVPIKIGFQYGGFVHEVLQSYRHPGGMHG